MTFSTRFKLRTPLYWLVGSSLTLGLVGCASIGHSSSQAQPDFGKTSLPVLSLSGYQFKDLNKNGQVDPYEDWRLSAEERARDLVGRMTLDEKAGLMMHGTAPAAGNAPTAVVGVGTEYNLDLLSKLINDKHINTFITRLRGDAKVMAESYNAVQRLSEQSRLGIPVAVSSDPRYNFAATFGISADGFGGSEWPESPGFAALNDPETTRKFGDIVRQEYLAIGITQALSPQADLGTEPRWSRFSGTFGEDAEIAKAQVQAYVEGFQGGKDGITPKSVVAVVKHWAGYGAAKDGWDSHTYYGRFMTHPSNNFGYHVKPFEGAFAANVGGVMPTYSLPDGDVTVDGVKLEQTAGAFSKPLLTDLLRGKYGFKGVIVSDWLITSDCDENCMHGWPDAASVKRGKLGTPWGMESATKLQRYVKATDAGVDQFGGVHEPEYLIQAVQEKLLTEARLNESAYRILLQRFQQGLFERPFVDVARAQDVVGNAAFKAAALDVQRRAMVLLKNDAQVLPLRASGKKVWLYKVDPKVAKNYGFTVVDKPEQADLAILRVSTPYKSLHPNSYFGRNMHEGTLAFEDGNEDYEAIKAAAAAPKSIVSVYMDRPAILTNVQNKAAAILANFGASDNALLDVLTGKGKPEGKLPYELPSSMEEVIAQRSDMPHDTAHPLYPFGFGLSY